MKQQNFIDLTMDLNLAFEKFNKTNIPSFNPALLGHVGTHIDIMDTQGPKLEQLVSKAHLICVENLFDQEISLSDTKLEQLDIKPSDSVIFKTNWVNQMLKTDNYFKNHPYFSYEVIDYLLKKEINLICLDSPGIRRGAEHKDADLYCAKQQTFIVENLVNVEKLSTDMNITLYCFPLNFTKTSGVTCRVVAAIN